MEAHPVPQNVTSFEFRLVGDMTLKQFGYLASGLVVAYLTFIFLFESHPFIASPIIATSALLGTAFAFLPIGDRPLDHWVKAFFKAVYNPTQRLWESSGKTGLSPSDPRFKNRLRVYLSSVGAPDLVTPEEEIVAQTTTNLQTLSNAKIKGLSRLLAPQNNTPVVNPVRSIPTSFTPPVFVDANTSFESRGPAFSGVTPRSDSLPQNQGPEINNSLTLTPNIITGVVALSDKTPIEGAIVIINNANQVPVRALKTNKLGQFLGATPLPAGTYSIEVEKEGFNFLPVAVTVAGSAVPPIYVHPQEAAHA